MRKVPQEEVAAAARRRLELLVRELDRSGVTRLDDAASGVAAPGPCDPPALVMAAPGPGDPLELVMAAPAAVAPAGRHAAPRRPRAGAGVGRSLLTLLPDTLRGRVSLDRSVFVVVAVLAVLAVGAAAVAVGRESGPSAPAATTAATTTATTAPLVTPGATALAPSPPGASPSSASPQAAGTVVVHVSGDVRRPGVVELATGARVADAVREAGGARRGVSLDGVNLARVLVDGEQVQVGGAAPPASGPAAAGTAAPAAGALVSLNSAALDQLDTLPGVGPVTAQKILDWRTANGAFSAVEELLEIDGIGEKTLAEIVPYVTL